MVQQGGADDLRVNITIQTFAQLRAAEQARANLSQIGTSLTQQRNALGQYAAGWTQQVDPALEKVGQRLQRILQESMGPRFIGSVQALNAAFIRTGQGAQTYATEALNAGQVSKTAAAGLQFIGREMQALGITGRVSEQSIATLRQQLATLHPTTVAEAEAIRALNAQLNTFATQQVVVAEQSAARLNRQLTSTQKIGQGMLLSFALTQGAAGNLSQAMFGLGFAVIFTGTQFLNLVTVMTAVGLAAAAMGLDKLQAMFKDAPPLVEQISNRMQEFEEHLGEAKGRTRLYREEIENLVRSGEDLIPVWEKAALIVKYLQAQAAAGLVSQDLADAAQRALELAAAGQNVEAAFDGIGNTIERQVFKKVLEAINLDLLQYNVDAARNIIQEAVFDYEQELRDAERLKAILQPFEVRTAGLDRALDSFKTMWAKKVKDVTDFRREAAEIQIDAIRDQVNDEVDAIREGSSAATDAVRDAVDEQIRLRRKALNDELDAIRDKAEDEVDIVRDNLEKQQDAIRDALDDRIKIIRDRAEDEIDIQKDKIDRLQDQEQALASVLRDLQSEREQIRISILGAEAQLAALEREAALTGVGATEEQAIIKARIDGLKAEQHAVNESIRDKEKERSGIQKQIDNIEELIDKIEDARDSAIEAARYEADARIDAAKNAADKIIDTINDQRDTQIEAAQDAADAEIRAAQKSADAQIDAINKATDASVDAAQDRADADIKAAEKARDKAIESYKNIADAATKQYERIIDAVQSIVDKQKESAEEDWNRYILLRDKVLPETMKIVKAQIAAGILSIPKTLTDPTLRTYIRKTWVRSLLMEAGFTSDELKAWGYQLGTRAIPGARGQPQLAVVHGGEKIHAPGLPAPNGNTVYNTLYITVRNQSDLEFIKRTVRGDIGQRINTTTKRGTRSFQRRRVPTKDRFA